MRPEPAMSLALGGGDWVPASASAVTEAHLPCEYLVKLATERWERREARHLRRAVFCTEQGLFEHDDQDPIDREALTLVGLSCVFGMPDQVVGTVRIHLASEEPDPGHWQGSRLAVHPAYRRAAGLGMALIRLAVGMAHARGATRFSARVQAQNAGLFQRLHWQTVEVVEWLGRPHHRMQADLAAYPPCADFMHVLTRFPQAA